MVAKAQVFMCQYCGSLYLEETDATQCEAIHASYENLEVQDSRGYDDKYDEYGDDDKKRFPEKILIGDKRYSGVLAEYRRGAVTSTESFYEHEPWNEPGEWGTKRVNHRISGPDEEEVDDK